MAWYRDDRKSWYDNNNPYDRRRQRDEGVDDRYYQRGGRYEDRYSDRYSLHDTPSYSSASRWPDSRERDYNQDVARGYSPRNRQYYQRDRDHIQRERAYRQEERAYSQRERGDKREDEFFSTRERVSRREESFGNRGTYIADRHSPGDASSMKIRYSSESTSKVHRSSSPSERAQSSIKKEPIADRSQGHRGYSPGERAQSSMKKELTPDRSQGHRGYSPGERAQNSIKKEHSADGTQGHKGYSPGNKGFSPGERVQSSIKKEHTADRSQGYKGYSPDEIAQKEHSADRSQGYKGYSPDEIAQKEHSADRSQGYKGYSPDEIAQKEHSADRSQGHRGYSPEEIRTTSIRNRRADISKEREKMIPDVVERNHLRTQDPKTSHLRSTETDDRQEEFVEQQELDISYGLNPDINKNVRPVTSKIKSQEKVTIDYGHRSRGADSQPGDVNKGLSFDEHLAQLTLMNAFAQKLDQNTTISQTASSFRHNDNPEECIDKSSSPDTHSQTDSNPVFHNVVSGVTKIHVDNKTINVSIGHLPAVETPKIEQTPTATVEDKLHDVQDNINTLLSMLKTKIGSDKEADKRKTKKPNLCENTVALKKGSEEPAINPSNINIPGFEQWADESSDSDLNKSKTDMFSSNQDEDLREGKYNYENIRTAQEKSLKRGNMETTRTPQVDLCKDIDYREIFTSECTSIAENLSKPVIENENLNKDVKSVPSMSEEELRAEFQKKWENKESETGEGNNVSVKEHSSKENNAQITRDMVKEQVQKEFQNRWENKHLMKERRNINQEYTDSPNFSRPAQNKFNNALQNAQFPSRNRQRSGPYQLQRNQKPEQRYRHQRFEQQQGPKMDGYEPHQLQKQQGHFTNKNITRYSNQVKMQDTHGFRDKTGNSKERNYNKSMPGRQHQGDAKQKENERQNMQCKTDTKGVSRFNSDRGHLQPNTNERKDKPNKEFSQGFTQQENVRLTGNQVKVKTDDEISCTKQQFRKELNEKVKEETVQQKNVKEETVQQKESSKHKLNEKSSKKCLKGFRIPKLGGNEKAEQKQSADTCMKTLPKQFEDMKDTGINMKKSSLSLPRDTPQKEEPINIFEKLSLEITPPKQKKKNVIEKQLKVEKNDPKSIKKESDSSSDSNNCGIFGKLEQFIEKTKSKKEGDQPNSSNSVERKKDKINFELKNKSFLPIKGIREINGQLYWKKIKILQPRIVLRKLTQGEIERKSKAKHISLRINTSVRKNERKNHSSEDSEPIQDIPKKPSKMMDNFTDRDLVKNKCTNPSIDSSEESSPVKQKKKAVQILSQSDDSEMIEDAFEESVGNFRFKDSDGNNKDLNLFAKGKCYENSPVKQIKKAVRILSESEDSEMFEVAQTKLINENDKVSDANNICTTNISIKNPAENPCVDETNKAELDLTEREDSETIEDDIRDGEFMEIGSDDETQELSYCFEPIDVDTLEPFEEDIGSAIAECLENTSPSSELVESELKIQAQNEMDCVNTFNHDKVKEANQNRMSYEQKSENVEKKSVDISPPKTCDDSTNRKSNTPVCIVNVSLDEDEEEASQSLFVNEPKTNFTTKLKFTTTDSSNTQTDDGKKNTMNDIDANISVQSNLSAENEEKNKANESEDDLPVIKRPKLKSRTRVTSRSFDSEADDSANSQSMEARITPRKKKLFKHKKVIYTRKEVSGHEGDVEDNDNNAEEPTQRYELDHKTQDSENQINSNACDNSTEVDTSKKDEIDGGKVLVKEEPDWSKTGYTQEPDTVFIIDDDDVDMVITTSQPVISLDTSDSDDTKETKKVSISIKKELNVNEDETVHDPDYWDFSSPDNDSDKGSDFESDDLFKMISRLSEASQEDSKEDVEHTLPEIELDIFSNDEEFQLETQKQSKEPEIEVRNESGTFENNESESNREEVENYLDEEVNQHTGRPTIKEHADGLDIIIEDMDDDETFDSSWSEDSYLSDLNDFEEITAQSTQKFPDLLGQDEADTKQLAVSPVKEKNLVQGSKVKYQTASESFDSEKTAEFSQEMQDHIDNSPSMTDNSYSKKAEDKMKEASDTGKYSNKSQIIITHDHAKEVETDYDQGETQIVDGNLTDNYTAETQIDQGQFELDKNERKSDYIATTQADVEIATSEYDTAAQVDSQQTLDVYEAETQVLSNSVENEDSDDSNKHRMFLSTRTENTHDDPQYELYLQKGDKATTTNISGRLGIKIDHFFHNENSDLHYSDDLVYVEENKGKGTNDLYFAETQPMEIPETESNSDNENDAYLGETQVDRCNISETDENEANELDDPYFAQTQQIDTSVISINSDKGSSAYIEQTQVDNENFNKTNENEIKETDDPYLAETQEIETAGMNISSDKENEAYMAETQVDREAVSSADDSVDAYSNLTQQDDSIDTEDDFISSDKIYDMSTQVDQSNKIVPKQTPEITAKDTLKKSILSLKRGLKKSTDLLIGKRSYSLENNEPTKEMEIYKKKNHNDDTNDSPEKKARLHFEETHQTESKTQGMLKRKEVSIQSKDNTRKSILIEPIASTSFYGSDGIKVPPARTQSFLDATKNIITTDASKDDTWLSKKSSKVKEKGKSGKRRRNKSTESAVNMNELISRARQGCQERQMKFKTNPECIADPAKKFKHQSSVRSVDEDEDVELPTFSQVIHMGIPLLDQSMLMKSRKNTEPVLVTAEVTTSTSTIVTSTVSMATSTSSVTVGSTVHVSISSTSASTSVSYTVVNKSYPSKLGDNTANSSDSGKPSAAKHTDTGDKLKSNSSDEKKPKYCKVQLSESDKQTTDNHTSAKLNDVDKPTDRHLSDKKDKHKVSTSERRNSSDKHSMSSDHKTSSKHRHSSGDKQFHSDKHRSSDKHKASDKHDPDKHNLDKHDHKDKKKEEHGSHKHKHKHKSSHRHEKDRERKHHKSKEHRAEEKSSNKTGNSSLPDNKNKGDVTKNKANKADSAVTVNQDTGTIIEKEPVEKPMPLSDNKQQLEKQQVTKAAEKSEKDKMISALISVVKESNNEEHKDKERRGNKKKDKNKHVERNVSYVSDEQVPSTSNKREAIDKRSTGLEHMAAGTSRSDNTSGKSRPSCLSGKSAEQKQKRTVTWGNNTVHGSQTQTNIQTKTCIPSTSAQSLMEKITPGSYLPVAQTVTYPPDLMKINDPLTWEKIIAIILKWNPSWFEERDKMEASGIKKCLPPPVADDISSSGLFQLVDKYISLEEYVNKFMLPLLMHETWQTLYTDWREKKNRGKLNKMYFLLNQLSNASERLQQYLLIGLMTREERKQLNCLNEGDLLTLRMGGVERMGDKCMNVSKFILAVVVSVSYKDSKKDVDRICQQSDLGKYRKPDSICVVLGVNVRKRAFTPQGITEIQPVSSVVSTKRQITALAYFPRSPLCRDLLFPSSNTTYCDRAIASLPHDRKKLNQSQSVAVNTVAKIVSRVAPTIPRICLLQGPPGTGKSYTITNIIRRIVQEKKGQCSICLTAPSHAAVDELLRKIIKLNLDTAEKTRINLVRLGKKHSVHPDVQCHCLDNLVQKRLMAYVPQSLLAERSTLDNKITSIKVNIKSSKDKFQRIMENQINIMEKSWKYHGILLKIQKWTNDLRRLQKDKENLEAKFQIDRNQVNPGQEKRAKSEILNGAHVIAGTLSSMGSGLLKNFLSQSNMFDCVIVDEATQAVEVDTLIPLQYGVSKLILVGDPEQLCPTVISQVAQDHKLNMSLFQRLDSHFRYNTGSPNPVIFLDTQYRMDREIASFPNNYIYEGRLKSDTPISKFNLVPYLLYDVREGEEQFSQGSRSMSNQMEAVFTAELCKLILQETKFVERSIGIIAPYAKQKDEILKQLATRGMKLIEVSTVDGFQGREKHIVIMSCVRAVSGSLGFVGNRNRMNVALTRAKYAMYLVGHFGALESSDEWKALIADARQRQKIVSVTVDTYLQDIRHCLKTR